jgi:meso-butanediol dehydrogenase / (S,S)-butanediol dehydrogenase / diacetyl reductase
MDTQRLAGRKALITGGAQGMGAAIAVHWAAQGAAVCVADLNEDGVAQVAADIRAAGGQATHFKLDVTSEEQAIAAVAHVVNEFGEINLLLNNAGVNKPTIFPDTPRKITTSSWA